MDDDLDSVSVFAALKLRLDVDECLQPADLRLSLVVEADVEAVC